MALLGKWLWRLGSNQDGLWKRVVSAKYGVGKEGWDVPDSNPTYQGLWRGILSAKHAFFSNMRFKVGCGQKIRFWLGLRVGDSSLALKYPRLFSCAIDKNANVSSYFSRVGSSVVWAPIFTINLPEEEDVQLLSMLVELEAVYIPVFGKDRRVWSVSTDGSFCLFFLSV